MSSRKSTYARALFEWLSIPFVFMVFMYEKSGNDEWTGLLLVGVWLFLAFGLLLTIYAEGRVLRTRQQRIVAYAQLKGYDYAIPTRTQLFSDSLAGDGEQFFLGFAGNGWIFGDHKESIYRRTRYGKYKISEVYNSVLEITLPRSLPNMLFDSGDSQGMQYKVLMEPSQKTSLEGNFDDHFTTYFPLHYHIDARSIISPEVMSAMLDMKACDIEISGDKLYVYSALVPADRIERHIERALKLRDSLADHIIHYRDERLDDASNRQDIAHYGQQLRRKPGSLWPFFFALIYLGYVVAVKSSDGVLNIPAAIFSAACGLLLFYVAYKSRKTVITKHKLMDDSYRNNVKK